MYHEERAVNQFFVTKLCGAKEDGTLFKSKKIWIAMSHYKTDALLTSISHTWYVVAGFLWEISGYLGLVIRHRYESVYSLC